jgi:hypothetical protein
LLSHDDVTGLFAIEFLLQLCVLFGQVADYYVLA